MAQTLLQLRTRVRERADLVGDSHAADSTLNTYINSAIEELYDIIVNTDQDYFATEHTFSTTSGTQVYSLPNDFYKLTSVNAQINGTDYRNISRYNQGQRNRSAVSSNNFKYKLTANSIKFVPTPQANTVILLDYIPNPTPLAGDTDEWNLEQFTEFIVVNAAIKALENEESDTTTLERRLIKLEENVKKFVYRDDADADSISDVFDNQYWNDWG